MLRRASAAAATLGVALMLVTGCGGAPAPAESTASFSSEDEAFAAAEATYRAYVDALNQVDLADPATFEPVFALTTGQANSDFRRSFSNMHAEGSSVTGKTQVPLLEPASVASDSVELAVCVDVSEVVVRDAAGNSTVDPNRTDVQPVLVTVIPADSNGLWKISSFERRDGEPACDA